MIILSKTCSSIRFLFLNCIFFDKENILYELYQKEGKDTFFQIGYEKVYEGKDHIFEVVGLKPKNIYTFKNIIKNKINNETIFERILEIETLSAPLALLSEDSLDISNGKIIEKYKNLSDKEKIIIGHCSKVVYEKDDSFEMIGSIEGVLIKISHSKFDNNDIYYLAFDLF